MAAQYKTKCPHCGAQFKISQEHLKQAGGQVRCGSCLEVFQATEHLVREKPPAKKPAAKQPAKKAAVRKAPPKQPAKKAPPQKKAEQEPRWTLPDSEEKPEEKTPKDKLIEQNDTGVSLGESELSDSFMSLGEEGNDFGAEDFSDMSGAAGGQESSADESWAEELLEELGDDEPENDGQEPITPDNMSLLDEFDGDGADMQYEEHAEPAPADPEDLDFFRDEFGGFDDQPDEIEAIEVPRIEEEASPRIPRITTPTSTSAPLDMLKWGALSLVAALALAVQYLVFNFNDLARTPEWRSLYATTCNVLGCELPNPSDISRLRGTNLVVRNHPTVEGALVVDAILFNQADYAQPFPVLELSFSTLNGRPVASRRFMPEEYRSGELEHLERMPPDVPVHVSFEIQDPGENAVNYNLRFFPAPTSGNA